MAERPQSKKVQAAARPQSTKAKGTPSPAWKGMEDWSEPRSFGKLMAPIAMTYCSKHAGAPGAIEQRRYFAGEIQIGYATIYPDHISLFIVDNVHTQQAYKLMTDKLGGEPEVLAVFARLLGTKGK